MSATPHHQQPSSSRDSTQEELSDAGSSSNAHVEKVQVVLDNLKHQHAALMRLLPGYPAMDMIHSPTAGTSLATTEEEDGEQTPTAVGTSLAQKLARTSMMSSNSGGSNSVWFDAPEPEGAEEYLLDASPGEEGDSRMLDGGVQPNSPVSQSDIVSSSGTNTDADTDAGSDSEAESTPETTPTSPADSDKARDIVRRTELPSGPVGDEGSLFAVLKKNVGKVGAAHGSLMNRASRIVGPLPSCNACVIQRALDSSAKDGRGDRVLRSSFSGSACR